MKKLLVVLLIPSFLFSCGPKEETSPEMTSPEMTERAEVLQIIYQPGNKTDVKTTWEDTFFGKGDLPHKSHSLETPDKFSVAFKCQHGKFIVEDEGKGSRAERLWKKLDKGDIVQIRYQEVRLIHKDGREEIKKYNFLDANKVERK